MVLLAAANFVGTFFYDPLDWDLLATDEDFHLFSYVAAPYPGKPWKRPAAYKANLPRRPRFWRGRIGVTVARGTRKWTVTPSQTAKPEELCPKQQQR